MGLEFRRAGVHLLVYRPHPQAVPRRANCFFLYALSSGDFDVAQAVLLQMAKAEFIIQKTGRARVFLQFHEFGQVRQKPRVDARGAVYRIFGPSLPVRTGDRPEAIGSRDSQSF